MLFKAATRRTKHLLPGTKGNHFEGFIHEAEPGATFFPDNEDGLGPDVVPSDPPRSGWWMAAVPYVNGAAMAYSHSGPFDTREEAVTRAAAQMRREGWRDTRAEAETDRDAEIEYRSTHRADGTVRRKG